MGAWRSAVWVEKVFPRGRLGGLNCRVGVWRWETEEGFLRVLKVLVGGEYVGNRGGNGCEALRDGARMRQTRDRGWRCRRGMLKLWSKKNRDQCICVEDVGQLRGLTIREMSWSVSR